MCLCHGSYRDFVCAGETGAVVGTPSGGSARPTFSRRRFIGALLAGVSGTALAGCDPAGIGQMFISDDQVELMGLETWERLRAELPVSTNRSYQDRSLCVSERILRAIDEDPAAWEIEVFARPEANAFALPGNKIGIFEGMFEMVDDDHELAAVTGHEVGHNQAQHARQRLARLAGTQFGLQLVSVALRVGNVEYANQIAGLLGAGVQYGVILPYSREQELEADEFGVRYMARAGYDPRAAIRLWEKMREEAPRPPEFLSTHPAPDARIRALEALMPEVLEIYRAST